MRGMKDEHFRKLERMYLQANINKMMYESTRIEISEGSAEIRLNIDPKYFHALGAIHGSVYFKLLDDAAFFSVNSLVRDVFVLTVNFNIHLVRPADKGELKAVGKVRFPSVNLLVAESVLYNESGKEIAFGSGTFAKSRIDLTEEIGYK